MAKKKETIYKILPEVEEKELKVIDSEPIVIKNLNDVAFYWGWAEHFWKLSEHLTFEDPDKYKNVINGLRNKANDIVKEIERFKKKSQ